MARDFCCKCKFFVFFFYFSVLMAPMCFGKQLVLLDNGYYENEKLSGKAGFTIYCRQGENKTVWKIWKRAALQMQFTSSSQYEFFEAANSEQVKLLYDKHQKSWFPSWPLNIQSSGTEVALQLFNASCIGVSSQQIYEIKYEVKVMHLPYFLCSLMSFMLFFSAKKLSKNIAFYYGTGMLAGTLASMLIVFFIVSRLLPGKKAGAVVMVGGFSTFLSLLQYIWQSQILKFLESHYNIVAAYVVASCLLSFAFLYWVGPPTNKRSLDLVKWSLQLASLSLLYYSIQVREIAVCAMISLIAAHNFPTLPITRELRKMWWKLFPPKVKLLTQEEYDSQASECTQKALKELREYCKSPKCEAWKTVSVLQSPTRFASFVEGEFHLADDELLAYNSACGDSLALTPITSDESDADV